MVAASGALSIYQGRENVMDANDDNANWIAVSLFDVPPEDVPPRPSWEPGTLLVRDEPPRKSSVILFEKARN